MVGINDKFPHDSGHAANDSAEMQQILYQTVRGMHQSSAFAESVINLGTYALTLPSNQTDAFDKLGRLVGTTTEGEHTVMI